MKQTICCLVLALTLCLLLVSFAPAGELENKLLRAAKDGDAGNVQTLLTRGADINGSGFGGVTALMSAVIRENSDVVQLLVKRGADLNAKDENGWTALMYAVMNGESSEQIVRVLLENGADVNAKDKKGDTALKRAERRARLRDAADTAPDGIVKLLKAAGAH